MIIKVLAMRFLLSRSLILLTAAAMFSIAGCSDGSKKGPLSMDDALASIEKARKDTQTPPEIPDPDPGEFDTNSDEDLPDSEAVDVPKTGVYTVKVESSAGDYMIEVHRDWAPIGAERFYQLVKDGYYDECRYFRVVPGFMVQFGISGDPEVHKKWDRNIRDDAVKQSNKRGFVTFAKTGSPNSRTTQIFVNYGDNSRLDGDAFAPFGKVIDGMENVDRINPKNGESPDQSMITNQGNAYLQQSFPDLDYVKKMSIASETTE